MKIAACTIASNNYLAYVRVLAQSYREHHPDAPVYVCIVDRPHPSIDYQALPFQVVFAQDLDLPSFRSLAFRYSIVELNTAIKPYWLTHLRDRYGLDRVLYLDPDILVLDTLHGIQAALESHPIALTPHLTQPRPVQEVPIERLILAAGVYNLGFVGLRLDSSTAGFLQWWQDRLHRYGVNDPASGLFVDQSWMDLAPAYLDAAILRDPRYNVAYWNLGYRRPRLESGHWQIDGVRLGFFHFSGLDPDDPTGLSRNRADLQLADRPELLALFQQYRDRLQAADHPRFRGLPYSFGSFDEAETPIPAMARRLLQQIDPAGRRWADPFATRTADSFLGWLLEQAPAGRGRLNRMTLGVWEALPELRSRFPDVLGRDLEGYLAWLVHPDSRPVHGLGARFLGNASALEAQRSAERDLQFKVEGFDLSQPGPWLDWFNEAVPGLAYPRPRLTRLAMKIHSSRWDLQQFYPDPLGADQQAFAYWFVRLAPREYRLAPELVRPVLRSLAWSKRLKLRLKQVLEFVRQPPRPSVPALQPEGAGSTSPSPRLPGDFGVNLVGYFRSQTGVAQVARGSVAALSATGRPFVEVPAEPATGPQRMRGQPFPPEGAAFPISLLHCNADQTPRVVAQLPFEATARTYRVGYWFWELAHLPLHFASAFACVDEVWAPSRFCEASFRTLAPVLVRYVPPCVLPPRPGVVDRAALGLERDRFYFFCAFDPRSVPERKNPFGALEAVHRLATRTQRPVGLVLKVLSAQDVPRLLEEIRQRSQGISVVLYTQAASREEVDSLLAACDAFLSLHRSEGLSLLAIESLYLGKPVVATAYGGITDFLDAGTGYPVGFDLRALDRDFGPYPRGAVWAEPRLDEAVEQMAAVLHSPAEAAARAEEGRRRVESLYSIQAASQRFATEFQRIETGFPQRSRPSGSTPGPGWARDPLQP